MHKQTTQINQIPPRANSKLVAMGNRHFLIGGLTADKVTNDIYELRVVEVDNNFKIEWKLVKFKINLFKPRNSFAACGSQNRLYIWGGLQSTADSQKCLSDLIEVNVDTAQMMLLSLKEQIKIHSSVLLYQKQTNSLLAIGGTNQQSTLETLFYSLSLNLKQETSYQWTKKRLDCPAHQGFLWQHSAHLSKVSYFTNTPGRYLTTIGGCKYPQSPYNCIVQFDLNKMQKTNQTTIKYGLVSHDSIAYTESISIFGGSIGGDFNSNKVVLKNGEISYEKGHNAIGCASFGDQAAEYVIGGLATPESLNNVVIYLRQK